MHTLPCLPTFMLSGSCHPSFCALSCPCILFQLSLRLCSVEGTLDHALAYFILLQSHLGKLLLAWGLTSPAQLRQTCVLQQTVQTNLAMIWHWCIQIMHSCKACGFSRGGWHFQSGTYQGLYVRYADLGHCTQKQPENFLVLLA